MCVVTSRSVVGAAPSAIASSAAISASSDGRASDRTPSAVWIDALAAIERASRVVAGVGSPCGALRGTPPAKSCGEIAARSPATFAPGAPARAGVQRDAERHRRRAAASRRTSGADAAGPRVHQRVDALQPRAPRGVLVDRDQRSGRTPRSASRRARAGRPRRARSRGARARSRRRSRRRPAAARSTRQPGGATTRMRARLVARRELRRAARTGSVRVTSGASCDASVAARRERHDELRAFAPRERRRSAPCTSRAPARAGGRS